MIVGYLLKSFCFGKKSIARELKTIAETRNEIVLTISQLSPFVELKFRLQEIYGCRLALRFQDEENEMVTLDSQYEYEYAVKHIQKDGTLKLFLHEEEGSLHDFSIEYGSSNESVLEYVKGDSLGSGAFGTVFKAFNSSHGTIIALKEITLDFDQDNQNELELIKNEIKLFSNFRHPHLIRYLGTDINPPTISIFMEYAPLGSIASLLAKFGAFPENVIRNYSRQILLGLKYLHQNRVVHRDIKGANILVSSPGIIKLADFGASATLKTFSVSHNLKTVRGTPYWMAPEIITETGHGRKSDIWSVGCTIIEMATTKPPFSHLGPMPALFYIGTTDALPVFPPNLPSSHSLLTSCFSRNPENRPTADEILENFEFVNCKTILTEEDE